MEPPAARHANTVHGGSLFAKSSSGVIGLRPTLTSGEQLAPPHLPPDLASGLALEHSATFTSTASSSLDALLGEPVDGALSWDAVVKASSWTVHDGNFFASAVRDGQARVHNGAEQKMVESPQIRLALDEELVTWQKPKRRNMTDDPSMMSGSVEPSAAQSVRIIAPAPVSTLGSDAAELRSFTLESTIGMGQFASVHRARRNRDGLHVALKLWHRPVALTRPGSAGAPAAPGDVGPACDSEDVACFEQEVAMLHATVRPIEGLVKFIGYGFVDEASPPEVRGFMVMELIKGEDLRHARSTRQ